MPQACDWWTVTASARKLPSLMSTLVMPISISNVAVILAWIARIVFVAAVLLGGAALVIYCLVVRRLDEQSFGRS